MNRSGSSPIEERVALHIQEYFSDVENLKFIAGVSGGPDSMALLYIFRQLQVDAIIVHINYQKRGEAADKDQELVEQMANQWDFECHSARLDPVEAEGSNFQQWARDRRYGIFQDLILEYEADAIAVAHHEDDQIETVLQKLFRGAGLESWSAMSVWEPPLFRPLIDTSQQQISEYIEQHAIPYRTDRSNLKSEFARNLLRNEWLERLEEFFPGWRQNVLRLSQQAELFAETLNFIESRITDDRDRIHAREFLSLSNSLQKAVVLHLLKKRDPFIEITGGALDQLDNLPDLQTGRSIQLTSQYSLLYDRERLKLVYEQPASLGIIQIKEDELREKPFSFNGLSFTIKDLQEPDFEHALYLDCSKLQWPLTLRRWKAGDALQPFGMEGHQKVSDHLTNRRVSAAEKGKSLVLESFEETICAVIFPPIEKMNPPGTISELVKCDDTTSECLVVTWN